MHTRAAQFLREHKTICIASHISPDGDAIGSMLALGLGLLDLGKQVVLYSQDGVPNNLRFLPRSDRIAQTLPPPDRIDALVLVDCSQPRRVGEAVVELAKRHRPFVIDHHIVRGGDPAWECIEPTAAAAGEVVYHVLRALQVPMTAEIATCLYCAVVSDTGQFRYSNTTAGVLRLAAEFVAGGADPWHIASNLLEQVHPAALTLLRLALPTLTTAMGGRYAAMVLTQDMLREAEAIPEFAEDFVGYPRSLAGVEVAALYRELPDRRWKVSLRSKRHVDVAAIAARFDGGGHEHAAGCTLAVDLARTRATIEGAVAEALRRRGGWGGED